MMMDDFNSIEGPTDHPLIGRDEPEEQEMVYAMLLSMLALMLIFFLSEGLIHHHKPAIGHQTGLTVLCGVLLSVILWFTKGIENVEVFTFNQAIFFNFLLPPIIYNSGYNMRRKKFF
jgi:sodium/hydrogen exchanger-like protein 6/7